MQIAIVFGGRSERAMKRNSAELFDIDGTLRKRPFLKKP